MERRGFAKPKTTRTRRFKVAYQDRGYACKEPNGSLKPGCRRELYCPNCDAPECVFGGLTWKQVQAGAKPPEQKVMSGARFELYSQAAKRNVINKRAQGLAPSGKPLAETCFNCAEMREDGTGFVCRFRLLDRPVGESVMRQRSAKRMGCESFGMRLVMEIGKL